MFRLSLHGSTIRREVLAGVTTFSAMAYILVVNPEILSITGMDRAALVTSTALASAIGTLLMSLLTNYPIALAPGMGLNAFFTFSLCGQLNIPWQGALAMVFWTGVLFLILSLTKFREHLIRSFPPILKAGIQAGIGCFIFVIGLKSLSIVGNPGSGFLALRFEPLSSDLWVPVALAGLGCFLAIAMTKRKVPAALLISIGIISTIGLFVTFRSQPLTRLPDSVLTFPPSPSPVWFQLDWFYPFNHWETVWISFVTLVFVDLFDSVGTLLGVSRKAGLIDESGELPEMRRALAADATATTLGACLGSSTTTAYIESATGVQAGGKTGFTGLVVAACFLLALPFYPVVATIPPVAIAPALLIVGGLMAKSVSELKGAGWQGVTAAWAIVVLIPVCFQIAEGIAAGCVLYTLLMIVSRRGREVHWLMHVLSTLFLIKFVAEAF